MNIEKFEEIMEMDVSIKEIKDEIKDGLFQGLMIMRKYIPDASIEGADHDIVYSIDYSKLVDNDITEEDTLILRKMGWFIEHEYYLAHFV